MHLSWSLGSFLRKVFGLFEAGAAAWTTDPQTLLITYCPNWNWDGEHWHVPG